MDEVRMTVRLPRAAAEFLDGEATENFTSRNAEIVRSIRDRMKANGAAEDATSPRHDHNPTSEEQGHEYAKS